MFPPSLIDGFSPRKSMILKHLWTFLTVFPKYLFLCSFWCVVVLGIFLFVVMSRETTVKDHSLLVLQIRGSLSDVSESVPASWAGLLQGSRLDDETTNLQMVKEALSAAANDKRIQGVWLNLARMQPSGLASTVDLGQAIEAFRKTSQKPVWVWSPSFSQGEYLLASHADRLSVHPLGGVILTGLSSVKPYFGDTLRLFGVEMHVSKKGAYKSAPETLTRNEPSSSALQADKERLDLAWSGVLRSMETARHLKEGFLSGYVLKQESALKSGKTLAEVNQEVGLIDHIETYDDFWDKLVETFSPTKKEKDLTLVGMADYLNAVSTEEDFSHGGLAVLSLEGEITTDDAEGAITPGEVRSSLDAIATEESIKALVVRINSPGGDAVAAESIRASIERVAKEMPVVISMGDMTASGGYWIATAGQKIVASPWTLTGSIGAFSMWPSAKELGKRLTVGVGGYKTTPMAESEWETIFKGNPWQEGVRSLLTDNVYRQFVQLVAQSRKITLEEAEKVAQGRVWLGVQAKDNRLIDELGNLDDAIKLAKSLAKLPEDAPVVYDEASHISMRMRLMKMLSQRLSTGAFLGMILGTSGRIDSSLTRGELLLLSLERPML